MNVRALNTINYIVLAVWTLFCIVCCFEFPFESVTRVTKGTSMSNNFLWGILKPCNKSSLIWALLRMPVPVCLSNGLPHTPSCTVGQPEPMQPRLHAKQLINRNHEGDGKIDTGGILCLSSKITSVILSHTQLIYRTILAVGSGLCWALRSKNPKRLL